MGLFHRPDDDAAIEKYLKLLDERPHLHSGREAMKVVTSKEELLDHQAKTGEQLGVLIESPFGIFIVDLVENEGVRFPYIRSVPAHSATGVNGVVAFAVTENEDIVFVETFRHSTGQTHLELPRGFVDHGEDALSAASRELEEETGYRGRPTLLGESFTDTGLSGTKVAFVQVTVEDRVEQKLEVGESIQDVRLIPLSKVQGLIRSGDLTDGFSLQALTLYKDAGLAEGIQGSSH